MDICDNELIMLYHEQNEYALELLFKRYEKLIGYFIKKYQRAIYKLNINKEFLFNECLECFNDALEKYNPLSKASFKTFASLLINRKIIKIINRTSLQENLSLDYTYEDISLKDLIPDQKQIDPLEKLVINDLIEIINSEATNIFSKFELQVAVLMCSNFSNLEIAKKTNKSVKHVTNAKDRIKSKLKPIIMNYLY